MNHRNQSLDVLRGLAILLVICDHIPCFKIMRAGWVGVDLFFVLSGFLISGLLFQDILRGGRVRLGRFLVRRGFKIYPSLIVFLGLTAMLSRELRRDLWVEGLFLQNYFQLRVGIWEHTWSLAVEEHFYLALPFVLATLIRFRRLNLIPFLSLGLIVACFLLRLRVALAFELLATHRRIDALFAGVALGWLYHFHRERFLRLSVPAAGAAGAALAGLAVGLILAAPRTPLILSSIFTLNLLAFALLVLWAVPRNLCLPRLAVIGRYSYSIYLWHLPIALGFGGGAALGIEGLASVRAFVGCLALSLAVGVTMAELIEMPVLQVRERVFPSALAWPDSAPPLNARLRIPEERGSDRATQVHA